MTKRLFILVLVGIATCVSTWLAIRLLTFHHAPNPQIWIIPVDPITSRGLKLTVGLETQSEELFKAMTEKEKGKMLMMHIKSSIGERLGGLQMQDIESPAKINVLKNNILKDINEMLVPYKVGSIDKIIFVEFIYPH